ncbi:MAG: nucleotidyltransferase family protein [Acidobacteriota bacterium]
MSKTEELLLDCLKRNPQCPERAATDSLRASDWHQLLDLATAQRVPALLYHRLKAKQLDHLLPEEVKTAFRKAHRETTMRNMSFYGELRRLGAALREDRVPLLVLKGMYLAQEVYGNIGVREMNDIDALAQLHHLGRIVEKLDSLGYAPERPFSIENILQVWSHLPRFINPGRAGIEIHWNLTVPTETYTIDPAELWQRAVQVELAGGGFRALCPEDMLLHLCLHSAYRHQFAFGLRPSCDIAELLAHSGGDIRWKCVLDRAKRWGCRRGVYVALRLAKEIVDADVPDHVLTRLRPAEFDEAIAETAMALALTDARLASTVPVPIANLLGTKGTWALVKLLANRVFLSKKLMATVYPAAPDSLKIYWYYPIRVVDLLTRHGRTMRKVRDNEPELIRLAERKRTIDRFLLGG